MKWTFVITSLLLLLVANVLMLNRSRFGLAESFQNAAPTTTAGMGIPMESAVNMGNSKMMGGDDEDMMNGANASYKEGFTSYFLEEAAGSGKGYQSIGAYDGVQLPTSNNVSSWRYTAPNEKLLGAEFAPGPDSLFMFKNNQRKPECCGSSFSCGGGCVCTTPQQRQYLAGRGGNRSAPEDSA